MAQDAVTMSRADMCELCGASFSGTFRDRMRHLRSEHPAYARGVLLRVFSPAVFLVELGIIALFKGPQWVFVVALFSSFGMLFLGKQFSRAERRKAGARPTLPFVRLVREGGLAFLLVVPMIALLIAVAGRR